MQGCPPGLQIIAVEAANAFSVRLGKLRDVLVPRFWQCDAPTVTCLPRAADGPLLLNRAEQLDVRWIGQIDGFERDRSQPSAQRRP